MNNIKRQWVWSIISTIFLVGCTSPNDLPTPIRPTLTSTPQPTPSTTPIPKSTIANKIRLYHNHIATRITRDQYSFSVVVIDKEADFVPKSIQIVEQRTGLLIGQYELFDETQIESLCAVIKQDPVYETVLIYYFELPQGFMTRAYGGDFIFRITIEHSSGTQEIVEMLSPDHRCYQAVGGVLKNKSLFFG